MQMPKASPEVDDTQPHGGGSKEPPFFVPAASHKHRLCRAH